MNSGLFAKLSTLAPYAVCALKSRKVSKFTCGTVAHIRRVSLSFSNHLLARVIIFSLLVWCLLVRSIPPLNWSNKCIRAKLNSSVLLQLKTMRYLSLFRLWFSTRNQLWTLSTNIGPEYGKQCTYTSSQNKILQKIHIARFVETLRGVFTNGWTSRTNKKSR